MDFYVNNSENLFEKVGENIHVGKTYFVKNITLPNGRGDNTNYSTVFVLGMEKYCTKKVTVASIGSYGARMDFVSIKEDGGRFNWSLDMLIPKTLETMKQIKLEDL